MGDLHAAFFAILMGLVLLMSMWFYTPYKNTA
jgi:hypothetical protein